ncbi:MAG: cysteine synthase family protein [Candidatus Aenigmarchaeota archaeon]|nr:cysteine synthase family protein [Candidatus Aenigmarchaeota archaeon]
MILDAIGNTPIIKLDGIYVKLEHLNPSGSVKDRIAKYIVSKAERSGQLKSGYIIVEATSGNTGIAFSLVAAVKGYKMIAVMPKGMSKEREEIMRAFGAKIVYVHKDCVRCAVEKAKKLAKKPKHYMPRQFENKWNIEENSTLFGKEILKQVKRVDAFVAGVGTGGTVIGVGKAIKKKFPHAKIIAVEPAECALLLGSGYAHHRIYGFHKKVCEHHRIEGIGDGFIPKIVEDNRKVIDDVIAIKSSDAIAEMHRLARKGYFVGPSSGANFLAARQLKKKYKNVVTLFPDQGDRYLSELY